MNKEPKDKARWDLCKRCLDESWDSDASDEAHLLDFINQNCRANWYNPWRTLFNNKEDTTELCKFCPFKLEHAVFSQRKPEDD